MLLIDFVFLSWNGLVGNLCYRVASGVTRLRISSFTLCNASAVLRLNNFAIRHLFFDLGCPLYRLLMSLAHKFRVISLLGTGLSMVLESLFSLVTFENLFVDL